MASFKISKATWFIPFPRESTILFSPESNCFIEDYIHGVLQDVWFEKGMSGWEKWRIHIYHPEGSIKRSYDLNGRQGGEKFEDKQIW